MTATHNVKAYRNNMEASSEKAPFLGRYIPNETLPFEALCEQVAGHSGQTAIQVRAILEGSFDAIAELEKEGLAIVHLDGMSVCAVIKGSFPTGDAAFDPERNALNLAIRLDDSIRLALVNVTPRMVTDDDLPKVRVGNIKDLDVERPTNLIHGQHVFRVAGHKLILSDAGACAYLKGKNGVRHEVIVDNVHSDQLFTAHTAELLDGGDYTLWVESRAGVADGPLQRDSCRVKYLRVVDPVVPLVLTSIQTTGVQEGQVNETNTTSIRGQDNLYPWDSERDSVVVHFDGQELTVPDVEFSAGNETLQFQIPQRVGEVLDDDDTLSFTVTINGAVGTIDAVWKH